MLVVGAFTAAVVVAAGAVAAAGPTYNMSKGNKYVGSTKEFQ